MISGFIKKIMFGISLAIPAIVLIVLFSKELKASGLNFQMIFNHLFNRIDLILPSAIILA